MLKEFFVEDGTGKVFVLPHGAEIDAQKIVDRFEPATDSYGPSISLGGGLINIGRSDRTLGYRYTESILPVDSQVYVLGVVQEGGDIGAPRSGSTGAQFIISHRTEEALTQEWAKHARWLAYGAIGMAILGAGLIIAGLVSLVV